MRKRADGRRRQATEGSALVLSFLCQSCARALPLKLLHLPEAHIHVGVKSVGDAVVKLGVAAMRFALDCEKPRDVNTSEKAEGNAKFPSRTSRHSPPPVFN